ncbi:MAG: aspartate-semialdehyde dehydrogenase [Anaerolineales bacterium]|nr:aspartate-semialdehyde dehydrogenase [Anaerolineales bacterium]
MKKIKTRVGLLGATGMVGQNYLRLLENHPWFEVTYLAASPQSAGKIYREAVYGRWLMEADIPERAASLKINSVFEVEQAVEQCDFVFSAFNLEKQAVRDLENQYAAYLPVVSNNSAHRFTEDIPLIIPEVNPQHIEIISAQQQKRGWEKGFIITKPNCSLQSYLPPVSALIAAGYPVEGMVITTLQAVSGAGYPGPSALDMIDNIIPYIQGEEEKSEREPLKIMGSIQNGKFIDLDTMTLSVHCTRVPVSHGHMATVSLRFKDIKPTLAEIQDIWQSFEGVPQKLNLPSAPYPAIEFRNEIDRPQPKKDRDAGKGMAISVGRLRTCPLLDIRFVALSHNTIRGAAGGAILSAELLKVKGYI